MAKRVAIIGLGLIGGSIGLALKRAGSGGAELVGYARRTETAERAIQLGAIDRFEGSLDSAVSQAPAKQATRLQWNTRVGRSQTSVRSDRVLIVRPPAGCGRCVH